MALTPLATEADVTGLGYTGSTTGIDRFLDAASAEVRDAARSPISRAVSTVILDGFRGETYLQLPGGPVESVTSVTIDGDDVDEDDFRLVGDRLWRYGGWSNYGRPTRVQVTYTHGLAEVPADIRDLVCRMVIAALSAAADGGEGLAINNGGIQSESIDGATTTYATSSDSTEAVTEMTLPARTRDRLRARFGGGSSTVASR